MSDAVLPSPASVTPWCGKDGDMPAMPVNMTLRAIALGEEGVLAQLFQRRGVALAVLRRVLLDSTQTWLVATCRDDAAACAFWRHAFARLPFASVEAYYDPALPQFQLTLLKPAA